MNKDEEILETLQDIRNELRAKSRRWRPWQFSLRTLLGLMLVVAAFCGGWTTNEWKRQRELEQAQNEAANVSMPNPPPTAAMMPNTGGVSGMPDMTGVEGEFDDLFGDP